MHRTEASMREAAASDAEVARELVDMRNQAREITRAGVGPEELPVLKEGNMAQHYRPCRA